MKQVFNRLQKGKWSGSEYFTEVAACHFWNVKPSTMGLCDPEDDLAVMMEFYLASKTMEAYDSQLLMPK